MALIRADPISLRVGKSRKESAFPSEDDQLAATEVARRFSQVISRVGVGEEIEVVRIGVPVAQLRPAGFGLASTPPSW